jgi:hypothetical protein
MMSGGAFIPLKAGRTWPESSKQAEIGLAVLRKILRIGPLQGAKKPPAEAGKGMRESQLWRFPRVMANLLELLAL